MLSIKVHNDMCSFSLGDKNSMKVHFYPVKKNNWIEIEKNIYKTLTKKTSV